MLFRHLYNHDLAQASYLVGCSATGEALVVDPNRDLEQYLSLAVREGLRITAVTETHIHADFVSGTRELAARTGARVYLSDEGPAAWKYTFADEAGAILLHDGASFMVGNVRIDVLHTPGHTPEHLSFLVTDTAGATEPMGIFTGDFVFVGDVGRPDLLEKAAGVTGATEQAARQLFQSLQRFIDLSDYMQVWPGHGAGSACGRALGAVPQTTVGYEKRFNWAFDRMSEDRFVQAVLDGQPEPPPYFAEMKRVNKQGPTFLEHLPPIEHVSNARLAAALEAGTLIVDTRPAEQYAQGHIPGSINLPLGGTFLTWAGWLLPYDRPFGFIVDIGYAQETVQRLRLIGLDTQAGFWTPDVIDAWTADGGKLAIIERMAPERARPLIEHDDVTVLDVRNPAERGAGYITGSRNIPLGVLAQRLTELPADRPIVVHCQGGARSAIAASLLSAHGQTAIDLLGGFGHWHAAGHPTARPDAATGQQVLEPAAAS